MASRGEIPIDGKIVNYVPPTNSESAQRALEAYRILGLETLLRRTTFEARRQKRIHAYRNLETALADIEVSGPMGSEPHPHLDTDARWFIAYSKRAT